MRSVVFAVAVFAIGLGCSSSDSDSSPAAVTADKACDDASATLCDQIQTCAPSFLAAAYGDAATCRARAKLDCLNTANAPHVTATPTDIAACATAAKTSSCAELLNNNLPSACTPKPGKVADGAPCGSDAQCTSGFCGLDADKELCGVCGPKPTAGQACVKGKCPTGLVCSADGKTCGAPVATGGACGPMSACAAGSKCYASKCVANIESEGAACDEDNGPDCEGAKGLACLGNKCMKLTFVAAGQPCGITIADMKVTGAAFCEKNGWCKGFDPRATPPKFTGVCEAAAADGAPCVEGATINKGPGCVEPAECVGGKCTLPDASTCK